MVSESRRRDAGHRHPGSPETRSPGIDESDSPAAGSGRPATGRRRSALLALGAIGVGVLALDQLTKEIAVSTLDPAAPVAVLGGLLHLSLTRNPGAAFSLLRDYTFIFPLVGLVVLGWIGFLSRRLASLPWAVALGLVLGGVVGNLTDRMLRAPAVLHGHVVDFLSLFSPHGDVWPIFNIADMALVGGVGLVVTLEMLGRHRDGSRIPSTREGTAARRSVGNGSIGGSVSGSLNSSVEGSQGRLS